MWKWQSRVVKLPRDISGRELIKALKKMGYYVDHQKGSHVILYNRSPGYPRLSVPDHKNIRIGLLRTIIRDAGLTAEEFLGLL